MSNAKFTLPEKKSAWAILHSFLEAIASFPIELDAVIASSRGTHVPGGSRVTVSNLAYRLPGMLDDVNPFYHPFAIWKSSTSAKRHSLLHHFIFSSRGMNSFNSAAALGLIDRLPLVIGPAEPPHEFFHDDFSLYSRSNSISEGALYRSLYSLNSLIEPVMRFGFSRTIEACDYLVAVNDAAYLYYSRFMSRKKITVIPTGVSIHKFARANLSKRSHMIVMIGNIIYRKGYHVAILSMKKLLEDVPDAELHIVGDGSFLPYLVRLVKSLHLESSVHFRGRMTDLELSELMSSASVYCHASLSEGYSHTVVEAMGAGLPIVCTAIPGSQGMVVDGENGLLVPPGDPEALGEALSRVLINQDIAEEMGRNSFERAKSYDWLEVARRYYALYSKLAK
jgi:glycosyltransferase involved in cell wall biosynthesis